MALAPRVSGESSERDVALLAQAKRGDEEAFGLLFAEHYAALCGFTNSIVHSPDVAEELVQDVFLRVWEQRDAFHVHGTVRAYLFGAVRNHALNYIKHEKISHRVHADALDGHTSLGAGRGVGRADDSLYFAELSAAFETAMERLPEGQRTVLTLRWRYHLAHAEIAEALGISVKGVETQLGRALKQIRARLAEFR